MIGKVTSQASMLVREASPKGESKTNKTENVQSKEVDRVSELKEQIKSGNYKVDLTQTAEAVAKDMI